MLHLETKKKVLQSNFETQYIQIRLQEEFQQPQLAQAQWTNVKLRQPLIMRECRPGHLCESGKESHSACTAGGVRVVHWLMRLVSPSSSYLLFMDAPTSCLFFTRLCARAYIAMSVIFWQKSNIIAKDEITSKKAAETMSLTSQHQFVILTNEFQASPQ